MAERGRGLHRFPAGSLERKLIDERRAEIKAARKFAKLVGDFEMRGRRKFVVVRLPDDFDQVPVEGQVRFHRSTSQVMKDGTFGVVA